MCNTLGGASDDDNADDDDDDCGNVCVTASSSVRQRDHVCDVAEGKDPLERLEQTDRAACRQSRHGKLIPLLSLNKLIGLKRNKLVKTL